MIIFKFQKKKVTKSESLLKINSSITIGYILLGGSLIWNLDN